MNVTRDQHPHRPPDTAHRPRERNPGIPFDADLLAEVCVNRGVVAQRAATISHRHPPEGEPQVAWLLRAITCLDLTSVSPDDSAQTVRRLCAEARRPISGNLARALGVADRTVTAAAVCVHHRLVPVAVEALADSDIPVAAVAAGFPTGHGPLPRRLEEIRAAVGAGAREVDAVIRTAQVLNGRWDALYDEIGAFREACGAAHLKVILRAGELGTLTNVARTTRVAMMAGADFVKTSTGKEKVNATLPVGVVMARQIRAYADATGHAVGLKPAGGMRLADDALRWLMLVEEELGEGWLRPDRFRLGASRLLSDIERQLDQLVSGRGTTVSRHPMV